MNFVLNNARWLFIGALIAFSSGFGQTFFISLYAGEIRAEYALSHGEWGMIYSAGTLLSAVVMLWSGGLVDRFTTRSVASAVMVGLALVCLAMALNQNALLLVLVIFGLRQFGQGMLGHIAIVAAGRWFARNRGRAVSIVTLGYSASEALLPILFVALMGAIAWRTSWMIAALVTLVLLGVLWLFLQGERQPQGEATSQLGTGMGDRHWTRRDALNHWLFWMTFPAFLGPPMFSTALFFQQVHLTETKGWSLAGFVALYPLMTAATIISMLVTGWGIDRFGSRKVTMLFPLPMALGFVVFAIADSLSMAAVGFILHGLGQGMLSTLGGTFWPEFYGTRHLGSIRATATSAMVFGSAVGPFITGMLIDFGVIFEDQLIAIALYMVGSAMLATLAMMRVRSGVARA